MTEGNTFLFPKSSDDHLWAIISDPARNPHRVVVVTFFTFHDCDYEQNACVIYSGEHPFIKHATYVDFAAAFPTSDARLESLKTSGQLKLKKHDLSPALLAKIRGAVSVSQIPLECEKALEAQGLLVQ